MLNHRIMLSLIEDSRRREIAAAARERMAREARQPRAAGHARRNLGRLLVRVGVWLVFMGSPASVDADSRA